MKKLLRLFAAMLCFPVLSVGAHAETVGAPKVSAQSAILIHADSGAVLYEKDADNPMLIASLTKVMTAYVALCRCDPEEQVVIRPEWTGIEGSSMYLVPGEIYSMRELVTGMLLVSGNDAATAVACHIAGSEERFAELMNEEANRLGMNNSFFCNPHGLDEDGHNSTARDMAILMTAAMENDDFSEIAGLRSTTIGDLTFINHNKLLWNYNGELGGKTGYTKAAGRTLVSCAERNGVRLICVTLNDPDDWRDHANLCDWGFQDCSQYHWEHATLVTRLPVVSGAADTTPVILAEDLSLAVPPGASVTTRLLLPKFVFAELSAGTRAGALEISVNGTVAAEVDLVYGEDVVFPLTAQERALERVMRILELADRYSPYSYYASI